MTLVTEAPITELLNVPVLPAVVSDDGINAFVWCRYCDRFHVHGNVPGWRVAHWTVDDSPYRLGHGYRLEITEGAKQDLQPPRSERRKPRRRPRGLGYVLVHGWDEERAARQIPAEEVA